VQCSWWSCSVSLHTFFGVYAGLYAFFVRQNPFAYYRGLTRMWVTAFGTSSSAATLSTTIECCEKNGVSKEAINYVLPIGCTINMVRVLPI
jgi:Na+/H+-dicarboxylate symporter